MDLSLTYIEDTIAALSTTQRRSGIGIVRISGTKVTTASTCLFGKVPEPRKAELLNVYGTDKTIVDKAIAIFFPKPYSFTGEDVLELQGHGNPILLESIIQYLVSSTGIRAATPGEFLKRSYLNRKINLTQVESIGELIGTSSLDTAKCAMNSMTGFFVEAVANIKDLIVKARVNIESNICFDEEECISRKNLTKLINKILLESKKLYNSIKASTKVHPSSIAIAGAPNTGKSTIFNALTESGASIVTALSGTTRDVVARELFMLGTPINISDTAGIHTSKDMVEREGIKRSWDTSIRSSHMLLVKDNVSKEGRLPTNIIRYLSGKSIVVIINKIDLSRERATIKTICNSYSIAKLSAYAGNDICDLKEHLESITTIPEEHIDANASCTPKRRYLNILKTTIRLLIRASRFHRESISDLIAEVLGLAERELSNFSGEPVNNQMLDGGLLDIILGSLCVGK